MSTSPANSRFSRLYRWMVEPITNQLKRGITPEKLSWTIALGFTLGIFPILGSTSLVCIIAGYFLKLNQAILHLFKSLVYPLHLALILVFIRLGQELNGVSMIKFSITEMLAQFKESPIQFCRDFGMAALYGIEAWALAAILLIPLLRILSLPLLKKIMPSKEVLP